MPEERSFRKLLLEKASGWFYFRFPRNLKINMAPNTIVICTSFLLLTAVTTISAKSRYASARVESCVSCYSNHLSDVRQFILEDLPHYHSVELKHIHAAIPELVLFDEHDEEVERLVLSKLTREECNDLLVSKGFTKSLPRNDEM